MDSVLENILTESEMELSRTPLALSEWVNKKSEELSASRESKIYARSGKKLPKKFYEEIRPLSLFASRMYDNREDIKLKPNLGNEEFDAVIIDESSNRTIYVEISYAKDGYDDRLRLDVLNEKGTVNALGQIEVSGTKASGNRKISVRNEAVKHNEIMSKALKLVERRIADKCDGRYGENHILIIVFDDYLPFRTDEDRELLEESVKSLASKLNPKFMNIFLLGASGKNLINVTG